MFAQRLFLGFTHNSLKIPLSPQLKSMLIKEPFCIPPSESDFNIGKKIAEYLSEIPEKMLVGSASFLVLSGLNTKYKCE